MDVWRNNKSKESEYKKNILLWIFLFLLNLFSLAILSNINRYFHNTFHEYKALKKAIITETFRVDFHNKFIKFGLSWFYGISTIVGD